MVETKNANSPGVAEKVVAILRRLSCQGRLNSGDKGLFAAKNLADRPATVFQADVFKLPFAPQSFDYIYSMGGLHHTPDCEQAFRGHFRLLKPGGGIAILKRIPVVGRRASNALAGAIPISDNPDPEWRVLDTFDGYSPWYKHTYEEVFRWFESCGLENLRVIGEPIAVQGTRPRTAVTDSIPQATEVAQCAE
jgi:SAM-dependent methyltransferase